MLCIVILQSQNNESVEGMRKQWAKEWYNQEVNEFIRIKVYVKWVILLRRV